MCFSFVFPLAASHNEISRYSSEEISGNESNEVTSMTESERQAEINRQKEEMKIKRRKKKRTNSSMQSSTFKGNVHFYACHMFHTHTQEAHVRIYIDAKNESGRNCVALNNTQSIARSFYLVIIRRSNKFYWQNIK